MNSLTSYDAILFDVGGTLLDVTRDPQEVALESITHLGAVELRAFRTGVAQAVDEWRTAGGRPETEDLPATWVRHYQRALVLAGFDGDTAVAAQHIEDSFLSEGWSLFPDVKGTLDTIARMGYRLGVISNWPATLEATLERAEVRHYFPVIVASAHVGYAKPHPEIFRAALNRLRVEPPRALYVGDSVEHDVVGAQSVGLDVVLLDRRDCYEGHPQRIQSLSQLASFLERTPQA